VPNSRSHQASGIAALIVVLTLAIPARVVAEGAQLGEAAYNRHCAHCHNGEMPRMPSREALRALSPEHIETALSSFTMRRQGAALKPAERRAVAEYLSGRPAGSYRAPLEMIPRNAYCSPAAEPRDPLAGPAWNGWSADHENTRFQPAAAAGMTAHDVPRLKLKWAFGLPGVAGSGSQISIVGGRAFVGSRNGMVYALDARSGCLAWAFEADAGVRSTPVVGRASGAANVFFGDASAQMYALDATSGVLKWKVKVDTHPDAIITGGAAFHDGRLYVGISSLEEVTAAITGYECCTFRGSVVALDAATGRLVWRTYPVTTEPKPTGRNKLGVRTWGPSGIAIWSAPTLDPTRNRLYVATGDNYSNPSTAASDAIMALAMDTGRVLWTYQALTGDVWNVSCVEQEGPVRSNCPDTAGPDHDFGSSPAHITVGGRRLLLAGQKSGELYGIDADAGRELWKIKTGPGGILGGIEWGFATDGSSAYVSLSNALEKKAGEAGGLMAVDVTDGKTRWLVPPPQDSCTDRPGCNTGQPAAVTAITGVVFSGSLDGHVRGHEASTGKVIWDFDTHGDIATVNGVPARGGAMNGPGPTVAGGMLFLTSGYAGFGFMPGNAVMAFSVDGK
jgi:polyvinyl alcohol dehydrogenase (cytochrome)